MAPDTASAANGNDNDTNTSMHSSPFQCSQCNRTFARLDHLSRHVRTHTLEKPYSCADCTKTFARADLLKRHKSRHVVGGMSKRYVERPTQHSRRVTQACKTCSASKLKCSDRKPCSRCTQKRIVCEYDHVSTISLLSDMSSNVESDADDAIDNANFGGATFSDRGAHGMGMQLPSPSSEPAVNLLTLPAEASRTYTAETVIRSGTQSHLLPGRLAEVTPAVHAGRDDNIDMLTSNAMEQSDLQFDIDMSNATLSYSEMLRNILGSSATSPVPCENTGLDDALHHIWDQYPTTEYTIDDLAQFSFSNLPDVDALFSTATGAGVFADIQDNSRASAFEDATVRGGSQAFRASGWNWGPTSQDSTSADQTNLVLPSNSLTPENIDILQPSSVASFTKVQDRHRILSLLLDHCDKDNWVQIASTFPSEPLLDQMLQRFCTAQQADTLSWFHVASFGCDRTRSELLTSMIANGACLIPIKSIQQFGYVMPEALRYAIVNCWTKDNSTSRDLQLLQAWGIVSEVASWSGNKRQMEIGESNLQPLVTIMRRARWLRTDQYRHNYPQADDEDSKLRDKWQAWVEQESRKRLVYRTFVFDAQMSMMNHVNPLMSYSEMRVPLPDPNEMWLAQSAEEWKVQYWQGPLPSSRPQLSLADAIRIIINKGDWPSSVLTPASTLYVLYGLWGLVWEYKQLQETLHSVDSSTEDENHIMPGPALPSQREMLLKALNTLRSKKRTTSESGPMSMGPEPALVLEYLSMVLHVPLQGLQAFIGRDGEREARRIFPVLQEWTQTREARQAIWHAGQLYRSATDHPRWCSRDLRAMLVYQASITCWVYGVITNAFPRSTQHSEKSQLPLQSCGTPEPFVWLDGDYSTAVRKFIAISDGVPALHDLAGESSQLMPGLQDQRLACPLQNACASMKLAVNILRRSSAKASDAQPPLVDSVTRLMLEISKVADLL